MKIYINEFVDAFTKLEGMKYPNIPPATYASIVGMLLAIIEDDGGLVNRVQRSLDVRTAQALNEISELEGK